MDYYSFTDPWGMDGWVDHVGWPIADVWPTKWSSVQLAVWCRIGKVRRAETSVLTTLLRGQLATMLIKINVLPLNQTAISPLWEKYMVRRTKKRQQNGATKHRDLHSNSWWLISAACSVPADRRAWGRPVSDLYRQHPGWSPAGSYWPSPTPMPANWSSSGGLRGETTSAEYRAPACFKHIGLNVSVHSSNTQYNISNLIN